MNLLVVEDEATTRQSMVAILQRNYPDVVVHSAEDGEEALAKLELLHYNIVLADIKMPRMDGLSMLEEIARYSPGTLVIMISAYDYFYYAQRALQLGAFDYILKPFEEERILAVLGKAFAQLQSESARQAAPADVRAQAGPQLLSANWGRVFLLQECALAQELPRSHAEWQRMADYLQHHMKSSPDRQRWAFVKRDGTCLVLLATIQERDQDQLEAHLERLPRFVKTLQLEQRPHLYLSVGTLQPMASILLSQRHAQESAQFLFYNSDAQVLYLPKLNNAFPSGALIDALGTPVLEGRKGDIRSQLEKIIQAAALEQVMPSVLKQQLDQWIGGFLEQYRNMIMTLDIIRIGELRSRALQQAHAQPYMQMIAQLLAEISRLISDFNRNKNSVMLEQCIDYIEKNYSNPDLSLQSITEHFYFNPSYFSTLFKKQTGKTIMQYLTMVRITHAKELLSNLDIRVNEVAARVGFSDMRYFMRVFKSDTGLTPGSYRKQAQGRQLS